MNLRTVAIGREGLVSRLMKLAHGAVVDAVPIKDLPAQYGRLREATGFHPTAGDVWKALGSVALATAVGLGVLQHRPVELGRAHAVPHRGAAHRHEGRRVPLRHRRGAGQHARVQLLLHGAAVHLNAYGLNYPFIFAFLLMGTLVASTLAVRMKRQAESTARRAYRMEVLLESSRRLQAANDLPTCFRSTAEQVIKLLNRPVVMYRLDDEGHLLPPEVHDVPGTSGGDASSDKLTSPRRPAWRRGWLRTASARARPPTRS